ncbi:MAG: hypothetical protein R3C11_04435 [Planctomycetaceae bacterium]
MAILEQSELHIYIAEKMMGETPVYKVTDEQVPLHASSQNFCNRFPKLLNRSGETAKNRLNSRRQPMQSKNWTLKRKLKGILELANAVAFAYLIAGAEVTK